MAFDPGYGETLLTEEESDALTVDARELLGDPILRADLYDLEQQVQVHVADVFVGRVLDGTLLVSDLLADHFVREMHGLLYAPIWTWGGRRRIRETNIGRRTSELHPSRSPSNCGPAWPACSMAGSKETT